MKAAFEMRMVSITNGLQVWANAKLNFCLEISGKRPDGFHELSTFMVPVRIHDVLEFRWDTTGTIKLWCDSKELSTGPDNLIVRAATMLQEESKKPLGAEIRLFKHIPWQAGLGGGSSDAAATLSALNQLWKLNLTENILEEKAAKLGSDVPFFLQNKAAWCTGRGEKILPSTFRCGLSILVVKPVFGLSTASVYSHLKIPTSPRDQAEAKGSFVGSEMSKVNDGLFNRLQEPALELEPALGLLFEALSKAGAKKPLLCGSGSAIFALFEHDERALEVAKALINGPARNLIQHTFITRQAIKSCDN